MSMHIQSNRNGIDQLPKKGRSWQTMLDFNTQSNKHPRDEDETLVSHKRNQSSKTRKYSMRIQERYNYYSCFHDTQITRHKLFFDYIT